MLIGEFHSKIGEKKRVAIPKKIRDQMGDQLILTRGYENSLVLVDESMWKNIYKELIDGSFINKNIRDTTRFLVGSGVELSLDEQGRFVIPDPLMEYAQIKGSKEVVFVSLINWVEVWAKEKWVARVEYLAQNSESIAEQLSQSSNEQ